MRSLWHIHAAILTLERSYCKGLDGHHHGLALALYPSSKQAGFMHTHSRTPKMCTCVQAHKPVQFLAHTHPVPPIPHVTHSLIHTPTRQYTQMRDGR
jgi:hypothetical protein